MVEDATNILNHHKHMKRQTNKFCWNCFSELCVSKKLYRCPGCCKGWYCEEDCQFEDWERHKEWCKKKEQQHQIIKS